MIFHSIHKILGKKDFTTANFLKSFFFLKFRKYSKKNKEKYRQFIFEFRKISIKMILFSPFHIIDSFRRMTQYLIGIHIFQLKSYLIQKFIEIDFRFEIKVYTV